MSVHRKGNHGYFVGEKHAFTFEISSAERSEIEQLSTEKKSGNKGEWEDHPILVGDFKAIPFGDDNNLPIEIRDTTSKHNLAPRIFTKKKFLTWGMGPMLYTLRFENGKIIKDYVQDPEVDAWLKSWNHELYLRHVIEDFHHTEGHFTKFFSNRGARIGNAKIAKLEFLPIHEGRLAYPLSSETEEPTHVLQRNWQQLTANATKVYPLFKEKAPFANRISVYYARMQPFATNYYTRPDVIGSLAWIRRATAIPYILEALTNQGINAGWHIKSPMEYWEEQKNKLMEQCNLDTIPYNDEMLEDLKDETIGQLLKVLGGQDNVGKAFHSEDVHRIIGNTSVKMEWKIEPIKQDIKEFVSAQLDIAKRGDFATVAGLGLHQALSNIGGDGKSDSGSEQLYALKNYLLTEVHLPEQIMCEAVNKAISINWPNKKVKLGFYRELPEREEDITPSKRISNAV